MIQPAEVSAAVFLLREAGAENWQVEAIISAMLVAIERGLGSASVYA